MAEPNTDDTRLLVKFYNEPVKMQAKTEEAGRPIYEDREHISIIIPGDNRTNVVRVATDEDRERFPGPYAVFKKAEKKAAEGTPLEEWPALTKSRAKELRALGVDTVDQLAVLSDTSLDRYGDTTTDERAKARAYLAQAENGSAIEAYAAKSNADDAELARLKGEVERLSRDLEAATAKGKKAA